MLNEIFRALSYWIQTVSIFLVYMYVLRVEMKLSKQKLILFLGINLVLNILNVCTGEIISGDLLNAVLCIVMLVHFTRRRKVWNVLLYMCAYTFSAIWTVATTTLIALFSGESQIIIAEKSVVMFLSGLPFLILLLGFFALKKKGGVNWEIYFSNVVYVVLAIASYTLYLLIGLLQFCISKYSVPIVQGNLLVLFMSIVGILFYVILIWLTNIIYKKESVQNEKNMLGVYVQDQEKYLQMMMKKDEEMRGFRHDVNEHIYVLRHCMEQGDYPQALTHMEKMQENFVKARMQHYTGIVQIDVILSEKVAEMERKAISFQHEVQLIKDDNRIDIYDLCTIVMNILNNAVEAAEKLEEPERIVQFTMKQNKSKLYVCEKNPCKKNIVFGENGLPVTSKEDDNHGFGMKNVYNVVKKYDGDVMIAVKDGYYTVEIMV